MRWSWHRVTNRPVVAAGLAVVAVLAAAVIAFTAASVRTTTVASPPWDVAIPPILGPVLEQPAHASFRPIRAEYADAARMVAEGGVDCALTLRPSDDPRISSEKVATVTWVAAAPFLSDIRGITLSEARALRPGEPRRDGVVLLRPGDRLPGVRYLAVDGVRPDPDFVASGKYPFQDGMYILTKRRSTLERILADLLGKPDGTAAASAALRSEGITALLEPPERTISLTVVGDIMLARGVATAIRKYGNGYPMALVKDVLSSSDITFANLESPIGVTGRPIPGKMIWFRADPSAVECLVDAGIDAVTLANNHTLDYDSENLLETIRILDERGILHTGAGADITEARRPAILERSGLKVAFLGYSEFAHPSLYWSTRYPRTLTATETLPGTAPLDLRMIAEDIRSAKESAHLVAVCYHWGQEYTNYPMSYFGPDLKTIARQTIDLGADMVFGFHPHAVQGIEVYRGKPIAYSLGNFVMDQKRPVTRESMVIRLDLARDGVRSIDVIPAMIDECRPRILAGDEAAALMARIREYSEGLKAGQRAEPSAPN